MNRRTFDSLFTTNQLQMLKILLPCLPPSSQGGLAVYIKMQELQYTLEYMKHHTKNQPLLPPPEENDIFDQLFPYCSPSQKDQILQFQEMSRQMESIRDAVEMAQMMQDMFPEGAPGGNPDFSQLMGMFSAMGNNAEGTPSSETVSSSESNPET